MMSMNDRLSLQFLLAIFLSNFVSVSNFSVTSSNLAVTKLLTTIFDTFRVQNGIKDNNKFL